MEENGHGFTGCDKDAKYLYPMEEDRLYNGFKEEKEMKNMIVCNQTSTDGII